MRLGRRERRKARFAGLFVRYTLYRGWGKRLPRICVIAGGRAAVKRAELCDIPLKGEETAAFFDLIVRERVTPCTLSEVYRDFLCGLGYNC